VTLLRTFVLRQPPHVEGMIAFVRANWDAMAADGRPLEVVVREFKSKRSIEQNAKLHAILSEIAEQTWIRGRRYDVDTWREHYKRSLIGVEEIEMPDGSHTERGISTTTLDVSAFSGFMDQIQADATSRLGVIFSQ
jgi:hypothetical protein